MGGNDAIFLGDFGGTYLRMAVKSVAGPEQIVVYQVADWPDIGHVLRDYAMKTGLRYHGASFYLSHTGHVVDGALSLNYKATNPWSFRLDDIRTTFDFADFTTVNDLKAAAYSMLHPDVPVFRALRDGKIDEASDCVVIGVGTGVGHAYINRVSRSCRETYGGHFPATGVSERQRAVLDVMRAQKSNALTFIIEDILSGPGLMRLYTALATLTNTKPQAQSVLDLIPLKDQDPLVRDTAAMFAGFLGVHAHILCNAAHAYGGVYLCGGVIDRLRRADLFDTQGFICEFQQHMVPVVAQSLQDTPLYLAQIEHASLYGLDVMAGGV